MAKSSQPLHQAIWSNDEDTVITYLEQEKNLNLPDEHGLKPLDIAVMTNNETIVKHLLKDKKKLGSIHSSTWYYLTMSKNEKIISHLVKYTDYFNHGEPTDEKGLSPLHHAIINRNSKLIDLCIFKLGCNVNRRTKNGYTPLHLAAVANDLETIYRLLEKKAKIDMKTADGSTALHLAVRYKNTDCASFLIAMGSNVKDVVGSTGSSVLHIAVENDDENMIELLLQNDVKVECVDRDGKNLVHVAAEYGCANWVKFFFKKRININSTTKDNSTALLIALKNNKSDTANILLNYKADVNIRDCDGLSPLCAALQHKNTTISERLVSLGANVNNVTINNSSALHFAVKHCNKSMVAYLIQHGAKLGVNNYLGQNELHIAAQGYNNNEILQYLLESAMNVNAVTLDKSTALHYAVNSRILCKENVETLIEYGIDVDAENKNGDTALNLLCSSTQKRLREYNIIDSLLEADANPNHMGSDKKKPLQSCIENRQVSTAYLLLKKGANWDIDHLYGNSVLQLSIIFPAGCACTRSAYYKEFIKYGADINHVNKNGETVLHTSLIHNKHESLVDVENLVNLGAPITSNRLGENLLHIAIKHLGNGSSIEKIVTLFLEKSVNLCDVTTNGSNIIHYVVKYSNNVNIMKILLDKMDYDLNYSINLKNREGKTPLHIAAALGSQDMAQMLLEYGAYINIKDDDNNSAINHAIIGNHIETVKLFLRNKACITDKNKDGFNAYDLAEQKGRHIYQIFLNN